MLLEPLDPETDSMFQAYRYCKLFHASLDEFEQRPYKETIWMLKMDDTYHEAVKEMQEEANRR